MTTKTDLIAQCKIENLTMVSNVNGEEIELNAEEYEKTAKAWAEMRLLQIAAEEAEATKIAEKTALLAKLGITADEAKLLLS
jgi:hypothetical protein